MAIPGATPGKKRAELLTSFAALGFVGGPLCMYVLSLLAHLSPFKLDYYVFAIDGVLGFEPSFAAGMLLHKFPWLRYAASVGYDLMSAAPVMVFAIYLFRRSLKESGRVALTFALNLFSALPIYLLIPVCGPKNTFPEFPFHVPVHLVPHAILLLGPPPNGFPSVHTANALLTFWFLRKWKLGRVAGGIFVALTVLATLGLGEHYLVDLIAAAPYAMAMLWLGQRITRQAAKPAVMSGPEVAAACLHDGAEAGAVLDSNLMAADPKGNEPRLAR